VPSAGRSPLTYDRVYGKVLLGKAHGTPRGPVVGKQACGAKLELWSEIISMGEKYAPFYCIHQNSYLMLLELNPGLYSEKPTFFRLTYGKIILKAKCVITFLVSFMNSKARRTVWRCPKKGEMLTENKCWNKMTVFWAVALCDGYILTDFSK
jgi:hypothetical protein